MNLTVKLGGVAGAHADALAVLAEVATPDWVVVHGGGAEVAEWSRRLGLLPRVVDGLRVTDAATLDVVAAVLRGLVNARLVARFGAAGKRAVGICGTDGDLFSLVADEPLGFVGHVSAVNLALLETLRAAELIPIVAPLGSDERGQLLNVNADEAASAVAAARGGRLLLLTDVPGVERGGSPVRRLGIAAAERMLADGSAHGGMRPKLRAAIDATRAGCEVQILDGRSADDVRAALAGEPVGTQLMVEAGLAPAAGGSS